MKRILPIIFLAFLLFSCKQNNRPYYCHKCYIDNMVLSSHTISYEKINMKEIQHENFLTDSVFYANYYIINNEEELNRFYENKDIAFNSEEKNSLNLNSSSLSYFFVQIPKGYKAYKRNNKVQELSDGKNILLTENFYYYVSTEEIVYLNIDLVKDDTVLDNYTFNFYYKYDSFYSSVIKDNIRFIYSLSDKMI